MPVFGGGFKLRDFYGYYRIVSPEWFESFARYEFDKGFFSLVESILPQGWQLQRNHVWCEAVSPKVQLPKQGWKIHVSATPQNAKLVLESVATTCFEKEATFKFALDQHLLVYMCSKGWAREASGKFLTVYPSNDEHFLELLEELYNRLREYDGPYILSDKRYKDAKVLHYRYGGFTGESILNVSGERSFILTSPDGEVIPDIRTPYFSPPGWARDPFQESKSGSVASLLLNNGRYRVERPLGFSVTGGVYLATDFHNDILVVIKEARPYTAVGWDGNDAVQALKKEFRILRKLSGMGVTPEPIEMFSDWEHLYLVEEYINGMHLGQFTISSNPLIRGKESSEDIRIYVEKLRKIWTRLAHMIETAHNAGVVLGDLSLLNVINTNVVDTELRLIDLEAAWEGGVDTPSNIRTPGFFLPVEQESRKKEDDYYAFGSVMLGTLFPVNNLFDVEPKARVPFANALAKDFRLSQQVSKFISDCMNSDAMKRPNPNSVSALVNTSSFYTNIPVVQDMSADDELVKTLEGITEYIFASVDINRQDRLYPADPIVFHTNPLSIAAGAVGVSYSLKKLMGEVPQSHMDWILSKPINAEHYPPGLYFGLSGIAWGLLEIGVQDIALKVLDAARKHTLLYETFDLFFGASGYGLACIKAYNVTGNQKWLDHAVEIGDWLLVSGVRDARGYYWTDKGKVWLGYARGASGVALYLLYLFLASGEKRFYTAGVEALKFDVSYLSEVQTGHLSIPRGPIALSGSPRVVFTHYWFDGSAGVGTVLLRFWNYSKQPQYLETLRHLFPDVNRKYTVFPGLFKGLAGLGNFLLDAYEITGEASYYSNARKVANGINLFKVQRGGGTAFPGEQLYRLSTDFGTGSAGIGLFLNRLVYFDEKPKNFNFTLDELLPQRDVEEQFRLLESRNA